MNFAQITSTFATLEATSSRLAMAAVFADLLRHAERCELDKIIYLCQGRLGPAFAPLEFGMNERLVLRAIAQTGGYPAEKVEARFKVVGDVGTLAAALLPEKQGSLSLTTVYERLSAIAATSGAGSVARKTSQLSALLAALGGQEAGCVLRIIVGKLRLGVGDATLMDGISQAFAGDNSLRGPVEHAYNMCSDLGLVVCVLAERGPAGLEHFSPRPGRPVRMALAERLPSAEAILQRMGTVQAEPKFDGFRLQVHLDNGHVTIFSRRLENLTHMFPELVQAARRQIRARQAIIEGEAVAFNPETGEYRRFQITVQRKRKHEVANMAARSPLRLFTFELLYVNGEDYTARPFSERRACLEQILETQPDDAIALTERLITDDASRLQSFFLEMVQSGLEGIVAKRLDAPYHAGARNFNWVKLKRAYSAKLRDTVDVVLVGYLVGRGQRARFGIGSLVGAVYDPDHDRFRTVAKIGSGLSEEQWAEMKRLLDKVRSEHPPSRVDATLEADVWAEPVYVVEVQADEITRSPVHTAGKQGAEPGYALRFPRMINWIRPDKAPEDATTEGEIVEMYEMQPQQHV